MLKCMKSIIQTENVGEKGNEDGEENRTNAEIEKLIYYKVLERKD